MFCVHCGSQINDGAQFCTVCGKPQKLSASQPDANAQPSAYAQPYAQPNVYAQPREKSKLPLILGIAGGAAALAVLVILAVSLFGNRKEAESGFAEPSQSTGETRSERRAARSGKEGGSTPATPAGPDFPITGSWVDENFNYYYMDVSQEGARYLFDVTYSHAGMIVNWRFSGEYDPDSRSVRYTDGVETDTSTGPDGRGGMSMQTGETRDLKGSVALENGTLLWHMNGMGTDDIRFLPNSGGYAPEPAVPTDSGDTGYVAGSPLDDFIIKGYTYREAVAQGWGDEFSYIASCMGTEGYGNATGRFYTFIDACDAYYFDRAYLEGFDRDMAQLARNAVYAHAGRRFQNDGIRTFFESCKWYVPYIEPDAFLDSMLSPCEKANQELVVAYEQEMGWR